MRAERRIIGLAAVAAAAALLSSCATTGATYRPEKVGLVREAEVRGSLEVVIEPDETHVPLGSPVRFTSRVRNVGVHPVWVPRHPVIVYMWIYPTGRRDNLLRDQPPTHHFMGTEAVMLKPGEELVRRASIDTHYFPRRGITEFSAFLAVPTNTNSELQPFAAGRYISNKFGVRITGHP